MTWFADLSPCSYFGQVAILAKNLRTICFPLDGWSMANRFQLAKLTSRFTGNWLNYSLIHGNPIYFRALTPVTCVYMKVNLDVTIFLYLQKTLYSCVQNSLLTT